ncbi:MAG TPA: LCP family protein [Sporolactobacillaceae bacterium]|nr:LCP family protein [Sporolactobacillaceae bacterium]
MKKKLIIFVSLFLCLIVLIGGVYVDHFYLSAKKTADSIYKPLKSDKTKTVKAAATTAPEDGSPKYEKPISILLMGVDQRKNDPGRSDTLIVLTLNPQKKTMQMISIPRDTRATLGNTGTIDKINAAYFYGGPDLAVQTVDQFLNIHVDYYIRINMQGLEALVNALGGITVDSPISWHDEGYYKKGYYYKKGIIQLDGAQALGYVRMRHLDPLGDFGRNKRQRLVISAVVSKAASYSGFSKYQSILDAIQQNVITNITFDEMKNIALNYRSARQHVKTYEVQGEGKIVNKIWYLIVDEQERQKVHQMIETQLTDDTGV